MAYSWVSKIKLSVSQPYFGQIKFVSSVSKHNEACQIHGRQPEGVTSRFQATSILYLLNTKRRISLEDHGDTVNIIPPHDFKQQSRWYYRVWEATYREYGEVTYSITSITNLMKKPCRNYRVIKYAQTDITGEG
jgi:hypothetical protein